MLPSTILRPSGQTQEKRKNREEKKEEGGEERVQDEEGKEKGEHSFCLLHSAPGVIVRKDSTRCI